MYRHLYLIVNVDIDVYILPYQSNMVQRGDATYVKLFYVLCVGIIVNIILFTLYRGHQHKEYTEISSTLVSSTSQPDSGYLSNQQKRDIFELATPRERHHPVTPRVIPRERHEPLTSREGHEPVTRTEHQDLLLTNVLMGRLGNHMFQYASLLGIAAMNNRKPFISHPNDLSLLTKAFNLSHIQHTATINSASWKRIDEKHWGMYESQFESLPKENSTIKGFLCSYKYFHKLQNIIQNEFKFIDTVNSAADLLFNRACNVSEVIPVGLHVRRTDRLFPAEVKLGYTTAPKVYYTNAMKWMRTKHGSRVKFLVTTDDPSWTKDNLVGSDVVLLPPASPEVHMATLSKCSHVIMSVGTFGWWSGFFSGGDVIYYKKAATPGSFLDNGLSKQDFYYPHWIELE